MWAFICLRNVPSWINDRFMWIVHEIFHDISNREEIWFCWGIHVATEAYCKVLNTIVSLDSDVHEATNPGIEGSYMWVFNLFQIFSNKICSHEECIFKGCVHWEMLFLKLYLIFCLFYPILMNNVFDDMIYLIKTYSIFTLYYVKFEEIVFCGKV